MKITKRQLRRIIREEKARLLREIRDERSPQGRQTASGPTSAYDQGYEAGTKGDRSDMPLDQYGSRFYDAWMEGWDDGLARFHGGGSY
jgi:ribosome modulation factor